MLKERFFINPEAERLDEEKKYDKERKKELKDKKDKIKEEKKQAKENGKIIISQKEAEKAYEMLESLKKKDNGTLFELIKNSKKDSKIEPSLYWNKKDTGILCKCLPDLLYPSLVIDIKTTINASPWTFPKVVYDKGYHIQAAMIQQALLSIKKLIVTKFRFIVIENLKPYVVTNPAFSQYALKAGLKEFKTLLSKYKHCLEQIIGLLMKHKKFHYLNTHLIRRINYVTPKQTLRMYFPNPGKMP